MGAEDFQDMANTQWRGRFPCVRDFLKAYRNEFRGFGDSEDMSDFDELCKLAEKLSMPPA